MKIELKYDADKREGTLVFPNGRTLAVEAVSREQFEAFAERHGEEFGRRDCILNTDGALLRRGNAP